jgi:hypothetical protein
VLVQPPVRLLEVIRDRGADVLRFAHDLKVLLDDRSTATWPLTPSGLPDGAVMGAGRAGIEPDPCLRSTPPGMLRRREGRVNVPPSPSPGFLFLAIAAGDSTQGVTMADLNPQPLPPRSDVVRVYLPSKVSYDLDSMQRVTAEVLKRLGCDGCHSGRILDFRTLDEFVVGADLEVRETLRTQAF